MNFLIHKNKEVGLSDTENAEMERFMVLEHIIQLAKAKAIQKLNTLTKWVISLRKHAILFLGGELIPLFNPRTQNWFDHFEVKRGEILSLTPIGEATIKLLDLNLITRIEARFEMMLAGCYP